MHGFSRAKSRPEAATALLLFIALILSGLVLPTSPATGAPAGLAHGVVLSDANRNDTAETTGAPGTVDKGIPGVSVNLLDNAGTVVATTTTAADGSWSFAQDAAPAAAGPFKIRLDSSTATAGNIYAAPTNASANNVFIRGSAPNLAIADVPAPGAGMDALLYPSWAFQLALFKDPAGMGGDAVFTGTTPFDSGDAPGQDSSAANSTVRSGDTISYTWTITASSQDAVASSAATGVFEQTLTLSDGAVANFALYPAACKVTGTPATSITAYPSGTILQPKDTPPAGTTSVVLTCNLGPVSQDVSTIIPTVPVWTSGTSNNGGHISTTARVYGVDSNGTATIRPAGPVEQGPITITAAPRYDLEKTKLSGAVFATETINGVPTPGMTIPYQVTIRTDRKIGVESIVQPITVKDTMFGQYSANGQNGAKNAVVPDMKWYILSCKPTTPGGVDNARLVLGNLAAAANTQKASAVTDSGSCASTRTGGDTDPYQLTFSGIDLSGTQYPTKFVGGATIPADEYYVASYKIQAFVPYSAIDATTGTDSDSSGAVNVTNMISGFEPVSSTGVKNYAGANEPGYCATGTPNPTTGDLSGDCAAMEDGSRSNNVAGPIPLVLAKGNWGKFNLVERTAFGAAGDPTKGQSSAHSGDGMLQPGNYYGSRINVTNSSAVPLTGLATCDVFDNTTMKLATLDNNLANSSTAALVSSMYTYNIEDKTPSAAAGTSADQLAYQQSLQSHFSAQYAHVSLDGDDPLTGGRASDGTNNGSWKTQAAIKCNDAAITWYSTPEQVPGGIDAVNVVRLSADDAYSLPVGGGLSMWVAYQQRDTFNGGPHAGQTIPAGTIAVNYASMTSNTFNKDWTSGRSYTPQPQSPSTDGDRWVVTRAQLALSKDIIQVDGLGAGVSAVNEVGNANAGDQVIWRLRPSLSASAAKPAPVKNVQVTDTLPKYVSYNAECTSTLTGGTPPSSVTKNADGTTTLVWKEGTRTPNTEINPLLICTDLDPLTPNLASVTNTATITADGVFPLKAHTVTHTVRVQQLATLGLKKAVDRDVDLQNEQQAYTLTLKNFSQTLTIQPPTVLETLPFVGDATGPSLNRSPGSGFTGTNGLSGPVQAFDASGTHTIEGTTFYTTAPSNTVPQDLNADTNPGIWTSDTAGWATADWAQVTGFKFVSTSALKPTDAGDASGLVLKFETTQTGNKAGDLYANRYTAFSPSMVDKDGKYLLLTSNQTTVRIIGFSLGDLIWYDMDQNGKYDPAIDQTVPAGVTVEVHNAAGDVVATTTTDANGRWIANGLTSGDYYVTIPTTQFATGAPLSGAIAAPHPVTDPNGNQNEDVDHHAIALADGGVRSAGLIHLAADTSGDPILGNGPLNDNVAQLPIPALTPDDFTNLTLDLAVVPITPTTVTKIALPLTGGTGPMFYLFAGGGLLLLALLLTAWMVVRRVKRHRG